MIFISVFIAIIRGDMISLYVGSAYVGLMKLNLRMGEYSAKTNRQTNPLMAAKIYDSMVEKCESASEKLAIIETRLNMRSNQLKSLKSDASQFKQKLKWYIRERNQCLKDFAALLPEDGSVQWHELLGMIY